MLTIEVREKLKNSTKDLKGEENLHEHAQAAILPTDAFKLQISAQKKAPRLVLVNILVPAQRRAFFHVHRKNAFILVSLVKN